MSEFEEKHHTKKLMTITDSKTKQFCIIVYITRLIIIMINQLCGVVVTTPAFQAGRHGFNLWSDLYSRS